MWCARRFGRFPRGTGWHTLQHHTRSDSIRRAEYQPTGGANEHQRQRSEPRRQRRRQRRQKHVTTLGSTTVRPVSKAETTGNYFAVDACTYAATSAICCSLSWSPKGGIAPIPFVTRWITSAVDGFAASSDGPTVPAEPAAERTWQPPQPALAKTSAPPPDRRPRQRARGRLTGIVGVLPPFPCSRPTR